MPVYVDNDEIHLHGYVLCHMYADTLDELHLMAKHLKLASRWFHEGKHFPYYTLSKGKRAEAIRRGATPVTQEEFLKPRVAALMQEKKTA